MGPVWALIHFYICATNHLFRSPRSFLVTSPTEISPFGLRDLLSAGHTPSTASHSLIGLSVTTWSAAHCTHLNSKTGRVLAMEMHEGIPGEMLLIFKSGSLGPMPETRLLKMDSTVTSNRDARMSLQNITFRNQSAFWCRRNFDGIGLMFRAYRKILSFY